MFGRHAYWARGGCRPSFGSWAPRSRFFGPGEVRLAILSLLTDGPRHGYELMKMLAQRSGGIYRASAGTIYPTLQQLEDEGLIAAEAQEGKRVFQHHRGGPARASPRGGRRSSGSGGARRCGTNGAAAFDPEVQEIVRPAERVMKAAFSAMSGGSARNADKVREILERALRELEDLRAKE